MPLVVTEHCTLDKTKAEAEIPSDLGELMLAYQRGEMEAFDKIYQSTSRMLHKYLLSLTLDNTRAEELLQETFLQLHRARHTYQPERPAKPWIFGIARHVYLMDCRAWYRRRRLEDSGWEEPPELAIPSSFERFASRDQLRRGLSQLSPEQREPLLLHHFWGLSFQEIAGVLGIREGAAKVRAHRALARLRVVVEAAS
jgi:RNA polymerase sigma-70 factor (ECF subfamily)